MALPGEHGLHTRDGSLMKKKREQWEREKAESSSWFPFGADRDRSSTRTTSASEVLNGNGQPSGIRVDSPGSSADYNSFVSGQPQPSAAYSSQSSQFVMQTPFVGGPGYPMTSMPFYPPPFMTPQPGIPYPLGQPIGHLAENFNGHPINNLNGQPAGQLTSQPYAGQVISGQPFPGQLPVWPSPIGQIPASPIIAVPGQFPNPMTAAALMTSTPLVTYSTTTTTATTALQAVPVDQSQQFQANGYRTMIAIGSSVDVITPPPQPQLQIQQSSGPSAEQPTARRSSIDVQIEERRRRDEQLAEQERRELETIQREQEAQARQREREEAEKAERQRQMEEEMDAKQRAYQRNMERVRAESEALRKARLHKHRLLDAEVSHETVCQILGTTDEELIRRVLKDLSELERQRRIDNENLNLSHGSGHHNDKSPGGSARRQADGASTTPLARNARGRASLRAPAKSPVAGRTPRRSGSAERAAPTAPPRSALFQRPSTSVAGSAPTMPAAQRRLATTPQPKPRSRLGQPPAAELPPHTPSKSRIDSKTMTSNTTAALGSAMSVCSSKTTILVGESPFAGRLPHVRSPGAGDKKAGTSPTRRNASETDGQLEAVNIIVNRSLPLDSGNAVSTSSKDQRLEELFSPRRPTPFDGLKQYEAIAANFQAVQRVAAAAPHGAAVHAKAVQHLADLRTPPRPPPSATSKTIGLQSIGLFEPVQTRNKIMRQTEPSYSVESTANEDYGGPVYDGLDYAGPTGRQPPAPSSMGASTNLTPSDSSPASASPPLSNDCKSTSSSVENHGLDADDERRPTKPAGSQRFGGWRNGDVSGSSDKLSDTTSGASSVERPAGGANFAAPRLGFRRLGAAGRPPVTPFAQRLADGGLRRNPMDHPEALRRNLQSPTMKHLQESLGNLNAADGSPLNANESASRPTTPKPFNCESVRYRSLNLKHRTPNHNQPMLAKLAELRAQLKERQQAIRQQVFQ